MFSIKDLYSIFRILWGGLCGLALLPAHEKRFLPGAVRVFLPCLSFFLSSRAQTTHPLSGVLADLGPSYIKLGQFLATRPDLVGQKIAADLQNLQDRVPPFSQEEAIESIQDALGKPVAELFSSFGPVMAAASIAQVHQACAQGKKGEKKPLAVKILRPKIEEQVISDMAFFKKMASLLERFFIKARRLKPREALSVLEKSVSFEMDLRMEAAALSEMAEQQSLKSSSFEKTGLKNGFCFPAVDWQKTSRRVLTTAWVDGFPLSDRTVLEREGVDLTALSVCLLQSFLCQVLWEGFFHADLHQGNLLVDKKTHTLFAIDLGITGRLSLKERRFLAEILLGFITRNYKRLAEVHFEAGYVPKHQNVEIFAQALRAIGEPILGLPAQEISIGKLLTQLFQVTEQFDMETQPQLLLLQKTMLMVEGVSRFLNPNFNMWTASEPILRRWMEAQFKPQARFLEVADGAIALGRLVQQVPELMSETRSLLTSASLAKEAPPSRFFASKVWRVCMTGVVVFLLWQWYKVR